jgi:hypothetical protein
MFRIKNKVLFISTALQEGKSMLTSQTLTILSHQSLCSKTLGCSLHVSSSKFACGQPISWPGIMTFWKEEKRKAQEARKWISGFHGYKLLRGC